MEAEAICPYCKTEFVFQATSGPKDIKGSSTQTCPHCGAVLDTKLLLTLKAGGYGAREIKPVRSLHAK